MTILTQDQIVKMSVPELEKEILVQSKIMRDLMMKLRTRQSQDHKSYEEAKINRARMMTELQKQKQANN